MQLLHYTLYAMIRLLHEQGNILKSLLAIAIIYTALNSNLSALPSFFLSQITSSEKLSIDSDEFGIKILTDLFFNYKSFEETQHLESLLEPKFIQQQQEKLKEGSREIPAMLLETLRQLGSMDTSNMTIMFTSSPSYFFLLRLQVCITPGTPIKELLDQLLLT